MTWKPWRFQALLRLERGEPLFKTFAKPGRQIEFRRLFLEELYDEWLIERGKWGPRITEAGREVCRHWRQYHGLEPRRKYDERQLRVILSTPREPGCNIMLAERFGSTPEAIRCYRRRLKREIAARRSGGQSSSPQSPQG